VIHGCVRNGKAGAPRAALDPGLSAAGDLFGDEQGEDVAVGA
jgi:hypothetical protein